MTLKNAIRKAYHDENLELVSGCANKLRFGLGLDYEQSMQVITWCLFD